MARDAVLKRENPWQKLFAVDRKKIRGGMWDYLKENVDFPYYYLKDRIAPAEATAAKNIPRGGAKVVKVDGQRVACSRDDAGKLTTVSAVCTHMGCIVHWNGAEKSWDCPCHGSRFSPDGTVIAGPAETPLEAVKLPPAKRAKATHSKNGKRPAGKSNRQRKTVRGSR
jgi:Rieske Fe-S protein